MRDRWKICDISELCELIVDCVNKTAPSVDFETPFKMIRTSNIKNGRVDLSSCRFVEKDTYDKWTKRAFVNKNDILLTREAPLGEVGIVDFQDTVFLGQRVVQYRTKSDKLDPYFLLYSFLSSESQAQFRRHNNSGSIVSHIPVPDCFKFKIRTPTIDIQKSISHTLKCIDSKIALNNRINSELEAMAKTIYDYWFVQFDFPVSASIDGVTPSHPVNGHAPGYKSSGGKMVWSEELKREVPEGWEVKKLNDVMRIIRGASPRPIDAFMSPSGMPWIKISDATSIDNWFIIETKEFIKEEGVKFSRELKPNTLILSNSASPGIPKIVQINACVHDGWLIVDSYRDGLYNEFMLHYFNNLRTKILNMGNGSIFKNLKTDYIKELEFLVPPKEVLLSSKEIFENVAYKILINAQENQHLSRFRDWLLPMLMNGQVRPLAFDNGRTGSKGEFEEAGELMAAEAGVRYGG